jgi:hypothetical protein
MAVAFDAATTSPSNFASPITYTHTPVGTPTAALVALTQDHPGRLPSVTYGGGLMSAIAFAWSPDHTTVQWLFGLANPLSGAQTVAVSWAVGGTESNSAAVTVTGSDLSYPFGAAITNAGNSGNASGSLLIRGVGSLALAVVGNNQINNASAVAWSGATPGTERYNFLDGSLFQDSAGQTSTATGTLAFAWTNNNTSNAGDSPSWGLIALEIFAPPGGDRFPDVSPYPPLLAQ